LLFWSELRNLLRKVEQLSNSPRQTCNKSPAARLCNKSLHVSSGSAGTPVKNWTILLEQILLPACPCWRQLAHSDSGEDARVLLSGGTYAVSIPRRTFEPKWHPYFYRPDVLSASQATLSKHWRKQSIDPTGLANSFFIHHQTPDRRSTAPFMLVLWRQLNLKHS